MEIKKVLVSQPQPESDKNPYNAIATKYGVEITFRPFVKVEGLTAKEFRAQKINIADYTAVVFNSRNAIDHFFRIAEETRVTIPDTMKYFCTTESIAHYLQKYIVYRKRKINFGISGKLDDPQLIAHVMKNKDEKFLFPVADVHKVQAEYLADGTVNCTKAVMFRTVSNDFQPDEKFDYDCIIFFSPAGVMSLKKNFPDINASNQKMAIGALGPATAKAVTENGLRLDLSAPAPGTPSMPAALDQYLATQQTPRSL